MSTKPAGTPKGKILSPSEASLDHLLVTAPSQFTPRKVRGWLGSYLWPRNGLQPEFYQDYEFCQADFWPIWRDTISWGSRGTAKSEQSVPNP